jgi:hypothetical protein
MVAPRKQWLRLARSRSGRPASGQSGHHAEHLRKGRDKPMTISAPAAGGIAGVIDGAGKMTLFRMIVCWRRRTAASCAWARR